jgi:hypothetical protein
MGVCLGIYFNVFTLSHAFGFDSLRSKWNAPIFEISSFLSLLLPQVYVGEAGTVNDSGGSVDEGTLSCAPGFRAQSSPGPVACYRNGSWARPFPECLPEAERSGAGAVVVVSGDDELDDGGGSVWNGTEPLELDDDYKKFTVRA